LIEGDKNMMETSKTNFVAQYKPGKQSRVELKNCRILDVINGCYFKEGTVIVLKEGKIETMPGLGGETANNNPEFTIDLQGMTVLPSLYNTHCHLMSVGPTMIPSLKERRLIKKHSRQQLEKNMADCLAHGITHIRDAWQADLRETRALKERISTGEIPGPRILQAVAVCLPGSYLLEKESLRSKLLMPSADPSKDYGGSIAFPPDATEKQVRAAVDIAIDERGADVIKIGDEATSLLTGKSIPILSIEQLSVVADQARRRGVQSMMHHSSVESFRRGVKAGVSSLEHEPWDALLTQADMEAFKAAGCINDPTISVFYQMFSWKLAGNCPNHHPELKRLTEFRDKTYTFSAVADEYHVSELRDIVMNGYKRCASGKPKMMGIIDMSGMIGWDGKAANAFENICLLNENDVPMTTSNDTIPPCTPAMMNLELRLLDHLLKGRPDGKQLGGAEALKIATINSARSLGLERDFGSIETGKTADLVILDGDPLEDLRLIGSSVEALFMDGTLVINNCGLEVKSQGRT
jgi:imidazolonepropionase-like amidohydrolase